MECRWSAEGYRPEALVARCGVPRVVSLLAADGGRPPPGCLGAVADVSSPFLVYSQRRRTKAYARHMLWDPRTNAYVPDDVLVEIPKDYAGFFEILHKDPRHHPVHHSSISSVVASSCRRFLVRTVLGGFRVAHSPAGHLSLLAKHLVYPGEVLRTVRLVTKRWRLAEEATKQAETKYLLCVDLSGQEVCVPVAHPGTFCALYDAGTDSPHFVWRMDELLDHSRTPVLHFRLPVLLRLVFGWPPRFPDGRAFSGVLQLMEKRRPDTLVLYNFREKGTVVGELPMDADLLLCPAENQEQLADNFIYQAATGRCDRHAYCYVINMKVLDLDYTPSSTQSPDTAGRKLPISHGLMASALDMSTFDVRDIFPPVAEKTCTSSWPITFKDPLSDVRGDLPLDDQAAGAEGRRGQLRRNRSMSGLNKEDAMDKLAADLQPSLQDVRRSRVEEADKREAEC